MSNITNPNDLSIEKQLEIYDHSMKFGLLESKNIHVKQTLSYIKNFVLSERFLTQIDLDSDNITYIMNELLKGKDLRLQEFDEDCLERLKEHVELTKKLWFYMYYILYNN